MKKDSKNAVWTITRGSIVEKASHTTKVTEEDYYDALGSICPRESFAEPLGGAWAGFLVGEEYSDRLSDCGRHMQDTFTCFITNGSLYHRLDEAITISEFAKVMAYVNEGG